MSYEHEACCYTHALTAPPMAWAACLEEPRRGYLSHLVTRYTITDPPGERAGSIEQLGFSPLEPRPPSLLPGININQCKKVSSNQTVTQDAHHSPTVCGLS